MGADLCGYWMVVPVDEDQELLNTRLVLVRAILNDELTPKKKKKAKLHRLGIDVDYIIDCVGGDGYDELKTALESYMDTAKDFKPYSCFRDMNFMEQSVNGKNAMFIFAGELTCGDTPQGAGYQMLEALDRLGMYQVFSDAINWGARPARRCTAYSESVEIEDPAAQSSGSPVGVPEDPNG
jgi:hypothetical protein